MEYHRSIIIDELFSLLFIFTTEAVCCVATLNDVNYLFRFFFIYFIHEEDMSEIPIGHRRIYAIINFNFYFWPGTSTAPQNYF